MNYFFFCCVRPKCPEKTEEHYEKPAQNTYPVFIHHIQNPNYFLKYSSPLPIDDHSLNDFLNENRRLLQILKS